MKRISIFGVVIAIFIALFILSPMQMIGHIRSYVSKDAIGIADASFQTEMIRIVRNAEILENMTGVFEPVGTAKAGHRYKIIGESDGYFHVNFGRGIGFIRQADAVKIKSENLNPKNEFELTNESFITKNDIVVYDLVTTYEEIGLIKANMRYPITQETDKWYIIDFLGKSAYIEKEKVVMDKGVVAIMYHHFLQRKENILFWDASTTIRPSEFEWQMNYLKAEGYVTIDMNTLEEYLLGRINLPGKTVVITMDDGLKSNVLYAAPILRKYGFKANVFLITSRVKEEDQPWNANAIVTVSKHEMENNKDVFNYHGHTHAMHYFNGRLGAMNFLPYHEALEDLAANKQFLADNGFHTTHFSYPFGSNYLQSQSLLKDSGFTTAFTIRKGYNKVGDNPLLLKRWNIDPELTKEQFESILNTALPNDVVQ